QNPAAKTEAAKLQFSNHAVERMRSRGISMEPADVERLGQAIEKAQAKGSRETLVLMGDNAFIVNVKNKTVVTAMDRQMMKENVFTNIDSTVIL
ncbi:MAG TPA: TIGR02530 family flagellar biosynthesis protein, partial [Bdellovibrionales bacterium]|nr:TIGR02530 family flagellar biosynthesis protein [Bdellovibrionales bacterium]